LKGKTVLKRSVDFYNQLIVAKGERLLWEIGFGRPRRSVSEEEAPGFAHGKRVPVAEINNEI
jgi:hypothetical protein